MTETAAIVLDATGGGAMLRACLDSIRDQSVPFEEVVVFDNGSPTPVRADGARIVRSETNLGFAAGVNEAYRQTRSKFVAVINNDVTLDRDWLAVTTVAMTNDRKAGAVQTIIRRDANTIDGAGIDIRDGTYRQAAHSLPIGAHIERPWGVSATATLYRREALGDRVFDPRFFAYYEDVELSARLHESGWSTVVLPVVKATHLGSQSASVLGKRALRLRTRNRYLVARMHPGAGRIGALLREDLALLLRGKSSLRGILEGLYGVSQRPLWGQSFAFSFFPRPVERSGKVADMTDLHAVDRRERSGVQAVHGPRSEEFRKKRSSDPNLVVIATPDVVGERMAGPGIRAWNLSRELARHFPTVLVAEGGGPGVVRRGSRAAREAMRAAAVLIGQPARGLRRRTASQRMIFDLFDPVLLELREMYGAQPSPRERIHYAAEEWRLKRALESGDLFLCATPAQRELYHVAPERMIEVPFGVDLTEVAPAMDRQDVIVWGGGVWEWLDPQTAIDAVVRLNHDGVACRLLFLGRNRPNARRESRIDSLLSGGHPFLMANDEWVPYAERLTWLRRAKVAMMLHRSTPEARYSIRTRLFDAIATATPVVATEEGFAAELVAKEGLGIVVPPSDVPAVTTAVRRLLLDDVFHGTCVSNLERIRPRFAWPVVARPLIEAVSRWQTQS